MGLFDIFKKKPPVTPEKKEIEVNIESKVIIHDPPEFDEVERPTLEELVAKSYPSRNGLYPHEIVMLQKAEQFKIRGNQFPKYWYYDYSVIDPQLILNTLRSRGFLEIGTIEQALGALKTTELKEELKAVGQKVSGKKDELVQRLMENGDLDALERKYPDRYFQLTDLGKEELEENQYLFKSAGLDAWETNWKYKGKVPTLQQQRDDTWRMYNKMSMEHIRNRDYGLYRNTRYDMCWFVMEEEKYKTALQLLCEVALYDLNNLGNGDPDINDLKNHIFRMELSQQFSYPKSDTDSMLPPRVKSDFVKLKDEIGFSNKEFEEHLRSVFAEFTLPYRILTNDECVDVILAELNDKPGTMRSIYRKAKSREKEKLLDLKKRAEEK